MPSPRDTVRAVGPDATAFLQGQLSQDVAALSVGGSAWSWLLQPTGKVDALVRVTRVAPDEWLLDTDRGFGAAVLARLNRFKLRTKVDLEPAEDAPVGPVPEGAARIVAGWPAMGAELDERTIPAETGLVDETVSFTKGCYTGQELVARIDSRGSHVPRRLRGLRLAGPVDAGAPITVDGKQVGTVTSVAQDDTFGWVALGYVGRAVEPPAEADAGGVAATVEALPLRPWAPRRPAARRALAGPTAAGSTAAGTTTTPGSTGTGR